MRVAVGFSLLWWQSACAPREAPAPTASDGLVFVRGAADRGDLFRARLSDGAVQPLLETPDVDEAGPVWISSMLRVAFNVRPVDAPDTPARLDLIGLDGRKRHSATETIGNAELQPSVSPDGKRLVYMFQAPEGGSPRLGIRVLHPLSGRTELLPGAPRRTFFLSPVIGLEGYPVVVQARGPKRGDDIWLLQGDKGEALVSDPGNHDTGPRFDRAGASVFFTRTAFENPGQVEERGRKGASRPFGGGDVCRVEIATRFVTCVVQGEDAEEFGVDPSPTRDEIVFVRQKQDATDLFLVPVASLSASKRNDGAGQAGASASKEPLGPERRLTDSPDRAERNPRFSPDGERIVFVAGPADIPSIVVIDRQGKVLFETPGHSPTWAPPFR